jgi:tRNA (guanosine-2'-O-)-methyltransferase
VTDHKKNFMEKVLAQRTRHITLVLEDIYQSQNASAAVRTCECLGLQDIHIIEDSSKYSVNKRVLKGSNKWIDIHRYHQKNSNNAAECFLQLKANGYKLLVTDPAPDGISIDDVEVDQKLAIVMGNELRGHTQEALQQADQKIFIPMFGFTESFNISVSAAICLNILLTKLRKSEINWRLSDEEKQAILLQWVKKSVRNSSLLEKEFLKTIE